MRNSNTYQRWQHYLEQPISVAPLVVFRIVFGLLMLFSTLRYVALGWVDIQLVEPMLHFKYFGFEWIRALPRAGMYTVFAVMAISALAITLGWYYRVFTVLFFLSFTYVELVDITYYLNHYYFVSIVAFLLIWLPANRYFSLDVYRKPELYRGQIPRWCITVLKVQIAIVYVYAGLAKINTDWLLQALPLAIWLPAKSSLPLMGPIFQYKITAYAFSWLGMLFDTFIVLGLLFKKTRGLAYLAVVIFHTLTGLLFQIGIFPIVMIVMVTIFFSPAWHQRCLQHLASLFPNSTGRQPRTKVISYPQKEKRWSLYFYTVFIFLQLIFPWRYLLYPGNIFWTEEGYRFSWRVMLMEKAGTATFYVKDGQSGKEGAVINHQFLNPHQEKQMAMQPDLILQYARYLRDYYEEQGVQNPSVRAEVWVTLNGRPAELLVNPDIDLSDKRDSWRPKDWIIPYKASTSR